MDAREERLARNETLFREVNEHVRSIAEGHGNDDHRYTFFCECSNRDCTLKIELSLSAYEAVRARSTLFVVAPGHALPEIEQTIETTAGYDVVEKQGVAALLAESLDQRNSRPG